MIKAIFNTYNPTTQKEEKRTLKATSKKALNKALIELQEKNAIIVDYRDIKYTITKK